MLHTISCAIFMKMCQILCKNCFEMRENITGELRNVKKRFKFRFICVIMQIHR